jgi:hypothetical protein
MPSDLHVWVALDLHAQTAMEDAPRLRCPYGSLRGEGIRWLEP